MEGFTGFQVIYRPSTSDSHSGSEKVRDGDGDEKVGERVGTGTEDGKGETRNGERKKVVEVIGSPAELERGVERGEVVLAA